ncbi:MAG: mannonate dehydratase [Bacteroidales bacterium]|nr:mannonate dehydratase [Bacteroidales bacterium]
MLEQTWRWFGPADRITLEQVRQTGATGIVTALHQIPTGDVWTPKLIAERKDLIEKAGLTWSVVESVPVHEDIKKRIGMYKQYIENYKQTIVNLGNAGVKTICYNFMPVTDWSRTNLKMKFADGAQSLQFEYIAFVVVDVYILNRPNARESYPADILSSADSYFNKLNEEQLNELKDTFLLGFPGSGETFTIEEVNERINGYKDINKEKFQEHLIAFLKEIIPAAESVGVKMAIHPDDPPWSLMGLPRIVGTIEDAEKIINAVDSPSNGITFCTGSLGSAYFNNLNEMVEKLAHRINFAHLRNVTRDENLNFHEDYLFNGDIDMYSIMKTLILENEKRRKNDSEYIPIPLRPDHGAQILGDFNETNYPGYSLYGRMKNLAEIRGLEIGIRNSILK